jgi:hypothetical protein
LEEILLILINHKVLNLPFSFIWDPANTNIVIDRDIRKSTKTILTHQAFNNFLSHKPLEPINKASFQNQIDWKWTKIWFLHNPFDRPTSVKSLKNLSWKLKDAAFQLPTLDILKNRYPKLFSSLQKCFFLQHS